MRFLLCALVLCMACQHNAGNQTQNESVEASSQPGIFYYSIFNNADSSFGYSIYQDSLLLIQQKTIPAVAGNKGFSDSIAAAEIAGFAIHKLQSGVFPPTIQVHEIDSILNNK